MPRYGVQLPVSGRLYIEVEADSEEEAIEKALKADVDVSMLEEWETHEHITRGNVCYACHWDAEAELIDE